MTCDAVLLRRGLTSGRFIVFYAIFWIVLLLSTAVCIDDIYHDRFLHEPTSILDTTYMVNNNSTKQINMHSYLDVGYLEVYIGGIFPVAMSSDRIIDGYREVIPNPLYQIALSAFILAIDDINNKSDGVFDNILPNTQLKFVVDINQQAFAMNDEFASGISSVNRIKQQILTTGKQIFGVVNAGTRNSTIVSSMGLDAVGTFEILVNSFVDDFSFKTFFPNTISLPPTPYINSYALYQTINYFGWKKLALISSEDEYGIKTKSIFLSISVDIEILYDATVNSDIWKSDNLNSTLEAINDSGAKIFVLLMTDEMCAQFLVSAYKFGLLFEGTQTIGISLWSPFDYVPEILPGNLKELKEIMKGYLTVKADPTLYYQTIDGISFLNRYRRLEPTKNFLNNVETCSDRRDDSTNVTDNYLYKFVTSEQLSQYQSACLGIESFSSLADDLDPILFYTYASTIYLAIAIDYTIRTKQSEVSSNDVFNNILQNLGGQRIHSLVGDILLSNGIESDNSFGRGDRWIGHTYTIQNFNYETIKIDNSSSYMNIIGYINDSNVKLCSDSVNYQSFPVLCNEWTLRTIDNALPSDTFAITYNMMSTTKRNIYFGFGLILVFESVLTMGFFLFHRKKKPIRNAQVNLVGIICFAVCLGGVRVMLTSYDVSSSLCRTNAFLSHSSFLLFCGTFMHKLRRIDKLVNTCGIKRVSIDEFHVILYIGIHLLMLLILLSVQVLLGGNSVGSVTTITSNHPTTEFYCDISPSTTTFYLTWVIYVFQLIGVSLCVWYLHRTRGVPAIVNETFTIGPIMIYTVTMILFFIAFSVLTRKDYNVSREVVAIGFIAAYIPCLAFYTLQKLLLLTQKPMSPTKMMTMAFGSNKKDFNMKLTIIESIAGGNNNHPLNPVELPLTLSKPEPKQVPMASVQSLHQANNLDYQMTPSNDQKKALNYSFVLPACNGWMTKEVPLHSPKLSSTYSDAVYRFDHSNVDPNKSNLSMGNSGEKTFGGFGNVSKGLVRGVTEFHKILNINSSFTRRPNSAVLMTDDDYRYAKQALYDKETFIDRLVYAQRQLNIWKVLMVSISQDEEYGSSKVTPIITPHNVIEERTKPTSGLNIADNNTRNDFRVSDIL